MIRAINGKKLGEWYLLRFILLISSAIIEEEMESNGMELITIYNPWPTRQHTMIFTWWVVYANE